MELSYSKYYCCPQCRQNLSVESIEETVITYNGTLSIEGCAEPEERKAIKTGLFLCASCRVWYPVLNYVPVFFIFFIEEIHGLFAQKYKNTLERFSEYSPPQNSPEKGELRSLQSFSQQWKNKRHTGTIVKGPFFT